MYHKYATSKEERMIFPINGDGSIRQLNEETCNFISTYQYIQIPIQLGSKSKYKRYNNKVLEISTGEYHIMNWVKIS